MPPLASIWGEEYSTGKPFVVPNEPSEVRHLTQAVLVSGGPVVVKARVEGNGLVALARLTDACPNAALNVPLQDAIIILLEGPSGAVVHLSGYRELVGPLDDDLDSDDEDEDGEGIVGTDEDRAAVLRELQRIGLGTDNTMTSDSDDDDDDLLQGDSDDDDDEDEEEADGILSGKIEVLDDVEEVKKEEKKNAKKEKEKENRMAKSQGKEKEGSKKEQEPIVCEPSDSEDDDEEDDDDDDEGNEDDDKGDEDEESDEESDEEEKEDEGDESDDSDSSKDEKEGSDDAMTSPSSSKKSKLTVTLAGKPAPSLGQQLKDLDSKTSRKRKQREETDDSDNEENEETHEVKKAKGEGGRVVERKKAADEEKKKKKDNEKKKQTAKKGTQEKGASIKKTLPSGLQYEIQEIGKGPMCTVGKKATVRYSGYLVPSGKKFDRGTLEFRVGAGEMIKGFDEGVKGMLMGEKRRLLLPPQLAYGKRGAPPAVPPNATLAFDVQLMKMK